MPWVESIVYTPSLFHKSKQKDVVCQKPSKEKYCTPAGLLLSMFLHHPRCFWEDILDTYEIINHILKFLWKVLNAEIDKMSTYHIFGYQWYELFLTVSLEGAHAREQSEWTAITLYFVWD